MNKKFFNIHSFFTFILIVIMCGIIFSYQSKKMGFHEDEIYSLCSSINSYDGVMSAYGENNIPEWKTKDDVQNYITLAKDNYLNLKSIYNNQKMDNHPPFFYTLVHFSSILFSGEFNKYTIFAVNLIVFVLSCFVIKKILNLLNQENLTIPTLIFYGLSMGTISMVIFQRMYMLLTFFILLYFYFSIKIIYYLQIEVFQI